MKWSKFFAHTLKEEPREAEIPSHKLIMRAAMIKKLSAGLYNYLPLFVRSLRKVEAIIRREMENKDAQEILMPVVLPAQLWKESGRWEKYGKELWRVKDRKDNDFTLAPTHEEAVTAIARGEIKSYKDLPVNLFQIQTKVRDEIRPRFGLMRAREFIMKDGYSFHKSYECLDKTYEDMYEAYKNIFSAIGFDYCVVEADTGSIGGSGSHEFIVLAENGEDSIAVCKKCGYAANTEKAETSFEPITDDELFPLEKVLTKNITAIEDLREFFASSDVRFLKSFIVKDIDKGVHLFLIRGDYPINEVKISNIIGKEWELADDETILKTFACPKGYIGPINIASAVNIYADFSVKTIIDGFCGANKENYHLKNFSWHRDLPKNTVWKDILTVKESDKCPRCDGTLTIKRGIEAGHIFKLGTKYSQSMNAVFMDEDGKEKPFIMGCYGIGVTRIIQAAIEQNFDNNGIVWSKAIAPFSVEIILLDVDSQISAPFAQNIYEKLKERGFDVLLDDRNLRPGFKFKDADLVGVPLQVVVGDRNISEGKVEIKNRQTGEKLFVSTAEVMDKVVEIYSALK